MSKEKAKLSIPETKAIIEEIWTLLNGHSQGELSDEETIERLKEVFVTKGFPAP